jgi:RNA polymerase II subunit A-like phosphatase
VFRGVNVVFSGVIPINTKTIAANSWIWRMATSFGAECLTELLGKVTHLIAVNVSFYFSKIMMHGFTDFFF